MDQGRVRHRVLESMARPDVRAPAGVRRERAERNLLYRATDCMARPLAFHVRLSPRPNLLRQPEFANAKRKPAALLPDRQAACNVPPSLPGASEPPDPVRGFLR